MHIITQTRLRSFAMAHPGAEKSLRIWETIVRASTKTPTKLRPILEASISLVAQSQFSILAVTSTAWLRR